MARQQLERCAAPHQHAGSRVSSCSSPAVRILSEATCIVVGRSVRASQFYSCALQTKWGKSLAKALLTVLIFHLTRKLHVALLSCRLPALTIISIRFSEPTDAGSGSTLWPVLTQLQQHAIALHCLHLQLDTSWMYDTARVALGDIVNLTSLELVFDNAVRMIQ